ncbi:MAG: ABC transporter ATP-binding protein [Hyphomicrobium sp.]|nr:ABC transporter ATP-binding protein [Hyphomicrobium sp.]
MPTPSSTEPTREKLHIVGVSKWFTSRMGRTTALQDISLKIHDGEFVVLLGASGCGKSTLLRMIAGLEVPSAGRIFAEGREITSPGRDRGLIFQTYTSFPWLTVRKNVEYGMRLRGMPRKERTSQARHFIELVGLERFMDAYPYQLSGGMKQRVAIARTLANRPEVLLMDEPFGALDPETRWQMHDLMSDVMAKSKTTVIMVTHDVEEAILLADRIVFMGRNPGRIREVIEPALEKNAGDKESLRTTPAFIALERKIRCTMRADSPTTLQ